MPASERNDELQSVAKRLGYSGLIPFFGLAVIVVWQAVVRHEFAWNYAFVLLAYGAVILSFVGALHWAYAIRLPDLGAATLVWSVLPSLVGWAAMCFAALASGGYGVFATASAAMIATFALQLRQDQLLASRCAEAALPAWFYRLRIHLTIGAIASLLVVAVVAATIH